MSTARYNWNESAKTSIADLVIGLQFDIMEFDITREDSI